MNKKIENRIFPGMFAALAGLGLSGCLAIYTACSYSSAPYYFLIRQGIWLSIGLAVFCIASMIPFRLYQKYMLHLGGFSLLMLLTVALCGMRRNGMRGWLALPGDLSFQPSELIKGFFLLLIVSFATGGEKESLRFWKITGTGALFCGLILLQPDLGSGIIYFLALLIVLISAGFSKRWAALLFSGALLSATGFVMRHKYALLRITAFLNPDADFYGSGWHIKQFQYALAQGGLIGSGSRGALWANAYLPLSHSDSAFATIVETSGLIGGLLILAGFALLPLMMRHIALKKKEMPEAALFIFSAGTLCSAQALVHISVNVTMFPTTGLTLPFFSYGGSSLIGMMLLFGMVCSAIGEKAPEP